MTTQVSWYQKGKTYLDFSEARDSEWQWHQLGHMQVCTLLQRDTHTSTHHSVFYRPDALPAAQPTASKAQSTEGTDYLCLQCCAFLFNFNRNYLCQLFRFQDIASYCQKSAIFTHPTRMWRPC